MDSLSGKKFLEYESKLKYHPNTFDFYMKIEKNNHFLMTLLYDKTIEYYLKFNFFDFKTKNPEFKTIQDFFYFLNECKDKFHFSISENNKEYTDISLNFSENKYNKVDFRLINKNKNLDIISYKEKKLLSMKVDEIIEMCKTATNRSILDDINYEFRFKAYSFNFQSHSFVIFLSKIKLEIYNYKDNKKIIEEYVRTNYDINKIINENKLNEEDIYCGDYSIKKVINYIDLYIENYSIILKVIKREIPKAVFGLKILNKNENYTRAQYSKYFSEYFENYNPENNNKIFKYLNNELRNEIFNNIIKLSSSNEINQYKITGPLSSGKSMTLFIFSKINKNVIYINLKTLNKYRYNYTKCLEIIFSECNRLQIDENIFNQKMQSLEIQNNILIQLLYIIKTILDLTKENIILILDQYKEYKQDETDSYNHRLFLFKIKDLLEEKNNLNMVLCRSLDDHDNRYEMIQTWRKYKANPQELNKETQEFVFYYNKLFIRKKSNCFLYKYFYNNYKYIKKAIKYQNLNNLYNKIIEKMKKFEEYLKLDIKYVNLCDILIFLKNGKINIEMDKIEEWDLLFLIKIIPLKYFSIDINKNNFQIEPIFPFINYCITKYINMKECDKYYNEQYTSFTYFAEIISENYFDYSATEALQNKQIIEMPFDYNNKIEKVIVDDIIKFDEIKPSFDDINLEFSKAVNINKYKEEKYYFDEKENDIKEEKELKNVFDGILEKNNDDNNEESIFVFEDNIIIDLTKIIDEEILSKKIEEIIANYYLKNFASEYQKEISSINEMEEYYEFIAEETIEYSKEITDFKKEIYKKIIIQRKEEILKIIKENYNEKNKKGKIKIPISKQHKENNSRFNGDENFLIEQGNKKGDLFDYAILYGKRNEKIFIGFQMINYPVNEILYKILLNRHLYKRLLSPILINSINLLNCKIKEWYYFPVIYYRKDDHSLFNIGYKALLFSLQRDYEYLLYDPSIKVFLLKNLMPIKNLKLTDLSSLDNSSNLSNIFNYIRFPLNFFDESNYNKYKDNYNSGIYDFLEDFRQYSDKPKDIYDILSKKLGVNNLAYSFYFHFDSIDFPVLNFIYLYKKKESSYFIAIISGKELKIVDLETDKIYDINEFSNYIDLNYKYTYALTYKDET